MDQPPAFLLRQHNAPQLTRDQVLAASANPSHRWRRSWLRRLLAALGWS